MRRVDRTDKSPEPKCAQCGSKTPEHGFITKDVIHRGYNEQTRKQDIITTTFTVCKGTVCGAHLQFAHEG